MKKLNYFSSVLLLVSLLMTACGTSEADKESERKKRKFAENPIQWNNYDVIQTIPFDQDTLHVSYQVEVSYRYPQEYSNEIVKNKLANILNTEIFGEMDPDLEGNYPKAEAYVTDYIDYVKGAYLEQLNQLIPIWNGLNGDSLFTEKQKIDTRIVFNEANFISYQVLTQTKRGNDTSTEFDTAVTNIVLDVVEGRKLNEKDVFKLGYKEELNKRIVKKLLEQLDIQDEEEFKASPYWGVYDIASNNNFLLTRDNICYCYNPQEYADKSIGLIEVCFTYEEVKDLFADNSPLKFFLDNIETINK